MLLDILKQVAAWLAPPPMFTREPDKTTLPPSDGRRFCWVDAKAYAKPGGQDPLVPVVLFDPLTCGEARRTILFQTVLHPCEYGMTLDQLKVKYPAPPIVEDTTPPLNGL